MTLKRKTKEAGNNAGDARVKSAKAKTSSRLMAFSNEAAAEDHSGVTTDTDKIPDLDSNFALRVPHLLGNGTGPSSSSAAIASVKNLRTKECVRLCSGCSSKLALARLDELMLRQHGFTASPRVDIAIADFEQLMKTDQASRPKQLKPLLKKRRIRSEDSDNDDTANNNSGGGGDLCQQFQRQQQAAIQAHKQRKTTTASTTSTPLSRANNVDTSAMQLGQGKKTQLATTMEKLFMTFDTDSVYAKCLKVKGMPLKVAKQIFHIKQFLCYFVCHVPERICPMLGTLNSADKFSQYFAKLLDRALDQQESHKQVHRNALVTLSSAVKVVGENVPECREAIDFIAKLVPEAFAA